MFSTDITIHFFFPNTFYPWLLESTDAECMDMEGQLYITDKEREREAKTLSDRAETD